MIDEYIKALRAGEKEYKSRLSAGEYPYLPALDDICPDHDTMPQRSMGLIEIPTGRSGRRHKDPGQTEFICAGFHATS